MKFIVTCKNCNHTGDKERMKRRYIQIYATGHIIESCWYCRKEINKQYSILRRPV